MTYQASLAPISKEELNTIPCFRYINLEVQEADLEQWDQWFMQYRRKPHVYSTKRQGCSTFRVELPGGEFVDVDWRVYRTWCNTFHLRYAPLLNELGVKATNPHIGSETQFLVAKLMDNGWCPKALADCSVGTN
jgi:hypothetical protein